MSESPSPSSPSRLDEIFPGGVRRYIVPGIFVLLCFVMLFYRRPKQTTKPASWLLRGRIFGTTWMVKTLLPPKTKHTRKTLQAVLQKALNKVDWQMSTYKKKSELSLFNASTSTSPVKASSALLKVVAASQKVTALSKGGFDVTIGPIVNAWGFGPSKRLKPPKKDVLDTAKKRVGSSKLILDAKAGTLRKTIPSLYVDLSAIAKGYGVDVLAETLAKSGFSNYMVEIGGEVRARGKNDRGIAWRIGVEKPTGGLGQQVQLVIPLRDAAMATSGNYRNYILVNGRRVSHLIDARSASPVAHNLSSVTVVHKHCMMADALATALFVLGPDEGLKLATQKKWAVLFLVPEGKTFVRKASPAFQALLKTAQQP